MRRQGSSSDQFYRPFASLKQTHSSKKKTNKQKLLELIDSAARRSESSVVDSDEDELFRQAMQDVTPLDTNDHQRIPPPRPTQTFPRNFQRSEQEAYAQLAGLISGEISFDLYYTDEYVEGAVHGLPFKILRKLRRGEFSYQDYLDLHGYTRKEAKLKVLSFIDRAYKKGYRCVLIIPGRGLNSANGKSVLKEGLIKWLTHGSLRNIVLAFSSARACDGGLGALYVLLRRRKVKGKFTVSRYI
ncbi:MAG: Smr/MutS family protein [Deltaproteobacteria bacterium]|nr:Smr/MutS family protein [Deltaproteobacteria bacterium]MBW2068133.1 Smr/MutS family protein [Deltaproteobacteria bacterium]